MLKSFIKDEYQQNNELIATNAGQSLRNWSLKYCLQRQEYEYNNYILITLI